MGRYTNPASFTMSAGDRTRTLSYFTESTYTWVSNFGHFLASRTGSTYMRIDITAIHIYVYSCDVISIKCTLVLLYTVVSSLNIVMRYAE